MFVRGFVLLICFVCFSALLLVCVCFGGGLSVLSYVVFSVLLLSFGFRVFCFRLFYVLGLLLICFASLYGPIMIAALKLGSCRWVVLSLRRLTLGSWFEHV